MTKAFSVSVLIIIFSLASSELFSQFSLPYGDIKAEELLNKQYKPDPGADAIILSDIGIATLSYINEFVVEMERDVRIRIVNSNGYDYANIEIPFSTYDRIVDYKASTFNIRNGEKVETKIGKKSFFFEKASGSDNILKFNFPDVHEGSVIEYSYIVRYTRDALYTVIPWAFQTDIPTVFSSFNFSYPEACTYKTIISGSARDVNRSTKFSDGSMFGDRVKIVNGSWYAQNISAFIDEPYTKSEEENLIKLTFELSSINFPSSSYNEVTPSYESLTPKLLDRSDFGKAILTDLTKLTSSITAGQKDDLSKLKKVHEYITSNIFWNGEKDYTTSSPLKAILRKGKGNSADINLLLIAMLRSINIKADPVILSTRTNGTINQYSAMIQQFNYVLAYVYVNDSFYLIDATDPLRPFQMLPFDCLNGFGRLISQYDSKFVDLKNNEKRFRSDSIALSINSNGNISGTLKNHYSDYSAYDIRKQIKLEGEDGYIDLIKSSSTNIGFSNIEIVNSKDPYSDLIETCSISMPDGALIANDEIIFNPYLSLSGTKNPFIMAERKFPVDYGCPVIQTYSLSIKIPEGYTVIEKPDDIAFTLGKEDGKFEFKCTPKGDELVIMSLTSINKTVFPPTEYSILRNFYSKILVKQNELIVFKKIIVTNKTK